jgi:hypothetical protein
MENLAPSVRPVSPAAIAVEATVTPDGLAKRFFALTMLGIVVYVSAILWLMSMSSGSN